MKPDFFIAGGAKCGTTALFHYLSKHPSIFMPRIKEPQYFCSDLKTIGGVRTFQEYTSLFASVPAGSRTGEASCWYLYSKAAIQRIMAHNPAAKIIVILRNPADAAHSLHAAAWGHGHENIESFEAAWQAQSARLAGRSMPPNWPEAATLQYGAIYQYAEQIRRVVDFVPPAQRHIVIYEEFFANPRVHYAQLLDFLGVSTNADATFPVVNSAVGSRWTMVDRALRRPPRVLSKIYGPVRPLLHAVGLHPGRIMWRLNTVSRPKAVLCPRFRSRLEGFFATDIAQLELLLGRSLEVWRKAA